MHQQPISPAGVMIFLIWKGKFFLILRDDKPDISFPNTWSPVTGGVEVGENFFEAMQRELDEEIGFIPNDMETLGVSPKGNCFFFGRLSDIEASKIILGEGQRFDFFSYEELEHLKIGGAFKIYLDLYPLVFRLTSQGKLHPRGSDFNLANWENPTQEDS